MDMGRAMEAELGLRGCRSVGAEKEKRRSWVGNGRIK